MTAARESRLDSPHSPWFVLALSVLVVLPSLGLGFFSDDYLFLATLEGNAHWVPPWWDLYNFVPGPPHGAHMLAVGDLPWWAADGLRLHLVRPLTSASFALDHALFGRWALGYHLHSALWWVLLVGLVSRFFRANFPRRIALVASCLFVVSGAHGMVYAWIACRHLLIAGVFGVGALSLLQHALVTRRGSLGLVVALLLVLGLAASEAALGIVPFLLFAALAARDEGGEARSPRQRATPLIAPLIVTAAYLVGYKLIGGGSVHGGTYVDPISSPLRFLSLAAERLPMLLATALVGLPVEAAPGFGNGFFVVLGLVAGTLVALLLRALWPAIPEPARAPLRWLAPASLLAVGVGLGGIPGSRQLVLPNLFFAPMLACVLVFGLPREGGAARGPRIVRRGGAGLLAFLHVPVALLVGLAGVSGMKQMGATIHRLATSPVLDSEPPRRFFVLGTSDPLIGMYTPIVHTVDRGSLLRCWSMLASTKANTLVERTDENAIVFEIEDGHMLTNPFETLSWDPSVPMPVGFERQQCGATIRVLATREGLPSRVRVTFDASLDEPTNTILHWKDQALVPLHLNVGEKARLIWSPGPMGFL
jgi:hypothetical protein